MKPIRNDPSKRGRIVWSAVLLAVVCLPRVTIDAYLPSLPAMGAALHATDSQLQLTLTVYMAGYAASMLIAGPLADAHGRRPVLLCGLSLYLVATAGCAFAGDSWQILVARFLQALGGCCGTVVGRVMVRDRYHREEQAVMLSHLTTGMALSPIVAPLLGSVVEAMLGWRWVFGLLLIVGAASFASVFTFIGETASLERQETTAAGVVRAYADLLRDPYFLRYSLLISFAYCTYFPFVSESSVVLQRSMHLSGPEYALAFAATICGYVLGNHAFKRLSRRHDADSLIGFAVIVNALGSSALAGATALAPDALAACMIPMFGIMVSVGILIPACQFSVLQPYGRIAGTASGLFFFVQMAFTAVGGAIVSRLSDGTILPTALATFAASASLGTTWLATARVVGRRREAPAVL